MVLRTLSGRVVLPGGLRRSSTFLVSGFFSARGGGGWGGGGRDDAGPGPRSSGKPLLSPDDGKQRKGFMSAARVLVLSKTPNLDT